MFKRFILKNCILPILRLYWSVLKPKTYGSRALVIYGDAILLTRNAGADHWSLPGGKIEMGETPKECVVRELREELDLSISKVDYKLGVYLSHKEKKRDQVHIFVVIVSSDAFTKQWELDDACWFNFSALPVDVGPAALRRIQEF